MSCRVYDGNAFPLDGTHDNFPFFENDLLPFQASSKLGSVVVDKAFYYFDVSSELSCQFVTLIHGIQKINSSYHGLS